MNPWKSWRVLVLAICLGSISLIVAPASAIEPPGPELPLHLKQMSRPELAISSSNVQLQQPALSTPDWSGFLSRYGQNFTVYVDPRSGAVSNLMGRVPILPAQGAKVDAAAVGDLVRGFAIANQKLLPIVEVFGVEHACAALGRSDSPVVGLGGELSHSSRAFRIAKGGRRPLPRVARGRKEEGDGPVPALPGRTPECFRQAPEPRRRSSGRFGQVSGRFGKASECCGQASECFGGTSE